MSSNITKSLNNIFGVEENETDIPKPTVLGSPQEIRPIYQEVEPYKVFGKTEEEYEQEDDFKTARNNIQELTEKGKQALDGILDVARDTDKPSAYETAAVLIKTLSEVNKDLYDLHKKRKDLKKEETDNTQIGNVNVDKAVFVGTTSELLDQIEEQMAERKKLKNVKRT